MFSKQIFIYFEKYCFFMEFIFMDFYQQIWNLLSTHPIANAEFVLKILNAEFKLRMEKTELHDIKETTALMERTLNNAEPILIAEYAVNPRELHEE